MALTVVTPPSLEPVTLAEAKAHLRLEETVDDVYVQALITGARQYIEKVCWRALVATRLKQTRASFRGNDLREQLPSYMAAVPEPLPYSGNRFTPYVELVGGHLAATPDVVVQYLDSNGAEQTLGASSYVVESDPDNTGRIWLNNAGGYSWPTTLDRFDAVRLLYTVGWTNPTDVPQPLRHAILLLISQMYEYRTPQITGTIATEMAFTIDALTGPYRLLRL